jgi:hypothetical protein
MASAQMMPNPPASVEAQVTPTKVSPETPGADPTPQQTPVDAKTLAETNLVWIPVGVVGLAGLLLAAILVIYFLRRTGQGSQKPTTAPPVPSSAWPCLEVPSAAGGPCDFGLTLGNNTIGRDKSNDIVITPDLPGWETVSPHHARIYRQGGRWILEDLNSMNGVYVGGQRTGRNLLHEGCEIGIGGMTFIFHLTYEEASQES